MKMENGFEPIRQNYYLFIPQEILMPQEEVDIIRDYAYCPVLKNDLMTCMIDNSKCEFLWNGKIPEPEKCIKLLPKYEHNFTLYKRG